MSPLGASLPSKTELSIGMKSHAVSRLSPDAATGYGTLVPGGSRLSQGTIIHGTIRARVLGVNLLWLEATIEAAPAQLKKVQRVLPPLSWSAQPRPETPPRPLAALSRQEPVIGNKLHEALAFLDEGAASLAAANEHRTAARSGTQNRQRALGLAHREPLDIGEQ